MAERSSSKKLKTKDDVSTTSPENTKPQTEEKNPSSPSPSTSPKKSKSKKENDNYEKKVDSHHDKEGAEQVPAPQSSSSSAADTSTSVKRSSSKAKNTEVVSKEEAKKKDEVTQSPSKGKVDESSKQNDDVSKPVKKSASRKEKADENVEKVEPEKKSEEPKPVSKSKSKVIEKGDEKVIDDKPRKFKKFGSKTTAAKALRGIDLTDKNILITGASSGIGAETARVLYAADANVYMACRDVAKAQKVVDGFASIKSKGLVEVLPLDLNSLASVRKCADLWNKKNLPLHVLINNAGVMACPLQMTEDGVESQFQANHLGHFLLTELVLDSLIKAQPSRIVNVSSVAHSNFALKIKQCGNASVYDAMGGAWAAYGQSKAANVLFTIELARRFKALNLNITANALHPGVIKTELGRHAPAFSAFASIGKSIPQGAATTVVLATAPEVANISGKYFADCQKASPNRANTRLSKAKRLWMLSLQLAKLDEDKLKLDDDLSQNIFSPSKSSKNLNAKKDGDEKTEIKKEMEVKKESDSSSEGDDNDHNSTSSEKDTEKKEEDQSSSSESS